MLSKSFHCYNGLNKILLYENKRMMQSNHIRKKINYITSKLLTTNVNTSSESLINHSHTITNEIKNDIQSNDAIKKKYSNGYNDPFAFFGSTKIPKLQYPNEYADKMKEYAESSNWIQSLHCMEELDKNNYKLDSLLYGYAIESCARNEKYEAISNLFNNMIHDSILPDRITSEVLYHSFIQLEDWKKIIELTELLYSNKEFNKINTLNNNNDNDIYYLSIYRATIESCIQLKLNDKINFYYQKAIKDNIQLEIDDFNNLIQYYSKLNDNNALSDIMIEMKNKNIILTKEMYEMIIKTYIKTHNILHALNIFTYSNKNEIPYDVYLFTFNYLYDKQLNWASKKLYNYMENTNILPSFDILSRMICVNINTKDINQAKLLFEKFKNNEVTNDNSLNTDLNQPTYTNYLNMIKACMSRNEIDFLFDIYNDLMHRNIAIDLDIYGQLIRAYGRVNKFNEAKVLFNKLINYNTESTNESYRIENSKLPLYLSIINAACKTNNIEFAKNIWYQSNFEQSKLTSWGYLSLLDSYASCQLFDIANDIINTIKDKFGENYISSDVYMSLITGLAKVNDDEKIYLLLKEMNDKNIPINKSILRSAGLLFLKNKKIDKFHYLLTQSCNHNISNDHIIENKNKFNISLGKVIGDLLSTSICIHDWETSYYILNYCKNYNVMPDIPKVQLAFLLNEILDMYTTFNKDNKVNESIDNNNNYIIYANIAIVLAQQLLSRGSLSLTHYPLIKSTMKLCLNTKKLDAVIALDNLLNRYNDILPKDIERYDIIFEASIMAKKYNLYQSIANEIKNNINNINYTNNTYSLFICYECLNHNDTNIIQLWNEIKELKHIELTSFAYNAIICTLGKHKKSNGLIELLDLFTNNPTIPLTNHLYKSFIIAFENLNMKKQIDLTNTLFNPIFTNELDKLYYDIEIYQDRKDIPTLYHLIKNIINHNHMIKDTILIQFFQLCLNKKIYNNYMIELANLIIDKNLFIPLHVQDDILSIMLYYGLYEKGYYYIHRLSMDYKRKINLNKIISFYANNNKFIELRNEYFNKPNIICTATHYDQVIGIALERNNYEEIIQFYRSLKLEFIEPTTTLLTKVLIASCYLDDPNIAKNVLLDITTNPSISNQLYNYIKNNTKLFDFLIKYNLIHNINMPEINHSLNTINLNDHLAHIHSESSFKDIHSNKAIQDVQSIMNNNNNNNNNILENNKDKDKNKESIVKKNKNKLFETFLQENT